MQGRTKLAILVNVIAPYRVPIYNQLGQRFETSIYYSGDEDNRASWQRIEEALDTVTVKRSAGVTFKVPVRRSGEIYDYRYIHVNPGYFLDLLRTRPNAVISNEMGFRTFAALLYGALFDTPVWVWWGGTLRTERNIGSAKKLLRRVLAWWVERWISYGATSTKYLLNLGIPREKIVQIQNSVDERLYYQRSKPTIHLNPRPVFLYVGQFIRRKGVDKLLEAAAVLEREGRQFSLLLVGSGPEKEAFEALVHKLGLQNVHFHPAQPPNRMPAVYRSADYLVLPTLEDNWGLVVNEALWSGVPVLSSVYAGSAEELLPNDNLFDPVRERSLVAVLKRALEGNIAPPDLSRLKTHEQVANAIIDDIRGVLKV